MKWIHNTAFWVSNIGLHACWSYQQKVHVFDALTGLSIYENASVRGGLLCKMEKWKCFGPRAWATYKNCQEGHHKPPKHCGWNYFGRETLLVKPIHVPHTTTHWDHFPSSQIDIVAKNLHLYPHVLYQNFGWSEAPSTAEISSSFLISEAW